jgi:magnesium-transporting ATPase (P-type)
MSDLDQQEKPALIDDTKGSMFKKVRNKAKATAVYTVSPYVFSKQDSSPVKGIGVLASSVINYRKTLNYEEVLEIYASKVGWESVNELNIEHITLTKKQRLRMLAIFVLTTLIAGYVFLFVTVFPFQIMNQLISVLIFIMGLGHLIISDIAYMTAKNRRTLNLFKYLTVRLFNNGR